MNQRGFIATAWLYVIAGAAIIAALGTAVYYIRDSGRKAAELEQLQANYTWLAKQNEKNDKAQETAIKLKLQAEREAIRLRRDYETLKVKYAELLNLALPVELIDRLRNSIAEVNNDLPASKPDSKLPVAGLQR